MSKYKMVLAYDGTAYSGWQIQPNGISIQETIQKQLQILIRERAHVTGAGRTDAGVHALGQVAHFTTHSKIDLRVLQKGLNALLPKDIRVNFLEEVSTDFHARYSAVGKEYHYNLRLNLVESPFRHRYQWQMREKIDLDLLKEACHYFVGTHDFTSFANEAHRGCAAHNAVRTIKSILLFKDEDDVQIKFLGNGFLYKMVRNIVGTLVECAIGKRLPETIPSLLAAKNRREVGRAAPAKGLFLAKVIY